MDRSIGEPHAGTPMSLPQVDCRGEIAYRSARTDVVAVQVRAEASGKTGDGACLRNLSGGMLA